jgi:hypothetical protein
MVENEAQVRDVEDVHSNGAEAEASGETQREDDRGAGDGRAGLHELSVASSAELIAVAPRREFRSLWLSDSYQLESVSNSTQPDMVGRDSKLGCSELALAFFDCFPPLF